LIMSKKVSASKKSKKGKTKSFGKEPSENEITLRKIIKLYKAYSEELHVKCSPDALKTISSCIEEDTQLNKVNSSYFFIIYVY
jgi:DNA polymerase III delta subunit